MCKILKSPATESLLLDQAKKLNIQLPAKLADGDKAALAYEIAVALAKK